LRKNLLLIACVVTVVCTVLAPWDASLEVWELLPLSYRMSMAGPMGGNVRDPGEATINTKSIDGRPPGRRC
jgi:hypothetical protein